MNLHIHKPKSFHLALRGALLIIPWFRGGKSKPAPPTANSDLEWSCGNNIDLTDRAETLCLTLRKSFINIFVDFWKKCIEWLAYAQALGYFLKQNREGCRPQGIFNSAVPNLFGTSDRFCERQLFYRQLRGGWFWDDSSELHLLCTLFLLLLYQLHLKSSGFRSWRLGTPGLIYWVIEINKYVRNRWLWFKLWFKGNKLWINLSSCDSKGLNGFLSMGVKSSFY